MEEVCWLSIDPVRRKVDFYPKNIAVKIEKSYSEGESYTVKTCVLGIDFFNATVHIHPSGSFYQTTPGMSVGRADFKQQGFRSVKRIIVPESKVINVYAKQVDGEWRIAANEMDSEATFTETIPLDNIISPLNNEITIPQVWKSSDLLSEDNDNLEVISWQWCRGVPEKQGDLTRLSNKWWSPYPEHHNVEIEAGFENCMIQSNIQIADRRIEYIRDRCYAKQYDETGSKERMVRRVIIRVSDIKKMLEDMANPPKDMETIITNLPPDSIPHHFFCVITQDIMKNPVSTVDNFTYEKYAIERWLSSHNTSPLTGLPLESKILAPNNTIYQQIQEFFEQDN